MTQLVLTAVGEDREGLVSALSRVVEEHGGNWLDSELARLAGKFAGIVLVEVPSGAVEALTAAAARLEQEIGWRVDVTGGGVAAGDGHQVAVHVIGHDRPGMVRQVSTALAEQHVSITRLHSWTRDAPEGDGVLFEADAIVELPDGVDIDTLRAALEPIADDLMVDVEPAEQGPA